MSERWKGGSTPAWRRIRLQVLERDGWRCQLRLDERCLVKATEAHHISPRELVGDDPAFLQAACKPCNGSYGAPETRNPPTKRPDWL